MLTFDKLTDQQRALLAAFSREQFRPRVLAAARALNELRALVEMWEIGGLGDIVALMDPAAVIPDETGLAGAGPVTAAMMGGYIAGAGGLLAEWHTKEQKVLYGQIAGPMNVIGH